MTTEPKLLEKTLKFQQPSCIASVRSRDDGKILGSAMVKFAEGAVETQVYLDAHTPEAFDLEQAPEKLHPDIELSLSFDGMRCIVWL